MALMIDRTSWRCRSAIGALTVFAACAEAQNRSPQTIEPTTSNEAAASDKASSARAASESGSPAGDKFVLSRKRHTDDDAENVVLHVQDKWWKYRADGLKISEAQARERDAEMSDSTAPPDFWDEQTAREAVHTWTGLCNECHGGRRHLEDALRMPAPPPTWGRGEGLFFGARRPYADVFGVVYRGGPVRNNVESEMPAWRGKLAKEMIWALMYFLEFQSGGIEGRFAPSLQPRMNDQLKRTLR